MGTPFDIALGCITIIESLNGAIKLAKTYIHSDQKANRELGALAIKFEVFKGIIGGIKIQAELEENNQVDLCLAAKDHVSGALDACKEAIEKIKDRLKNMGRIKLPGQVLVIGKVITNDIRESLKQFDDAMAVLQSALIADQRILTIGVYDETKKTGKQVEGLAEAARASQEEAERQKLGDWLTTLDPVMAYESSLAVTFPDAGRWFLDGEFGHWIRKPTKRPKVLWLKGNSGMGKTTLMSLAIDYLQEELGFGKDSGNLLAYFYCSSSLAESQRKEIMVRSLIKQLCERSSEQKAWDAVRGLRERLKDGQNEHRGKPSLESLQKTLGEICGLFPRVVLVLDALNEARDPSGVVKMIAGCFPSFSQLQIFVSSVESVDLFEHIPQTKVVEVEMPVGKVDMDIVSFVRQKMDNEKGLRGLPAPLKQEIQDAIKDRANGSFRWAECQIAAVRKARFPEKVTEALENMPPTLEGIYSEILGKIEDEEDAILTRKALIWLTFSSRELHVDELSEAMCLDPRSPMLVRRSRKPFPETVEEILHGCRDLVSFDANKKVAKLAHDSVRQFLLDAKTRKSSQRFYAINKVEDVGLLCFLMLRYMNLPDLGSGHCPRDQVPARLTDWPLLKYISAAFPSIFEDEPWDKSKYRNSVDGLMKEFIASAYDQKGGNFGSWFQVTSPKFPLLPRIYPIYHAASRGYIRMMKCILMWQGNGDINAPAGVRDSTPLHIACAQGHVSVVKLLLDNGADAKEKNKCGERGIEFAYRYGYKEICKLMRDAGAEPVDTTRKLARGHNTGGTVPDANRGHSGNSGYWK